MSEISYKETLEHVMQQNILIKTVLGFKPVDVYKEITKAECLSVRPTNCSEDFIYKLMSANSDWAIAEIGKGSENEEVLRRYNILRNQATDLLESRKARYFSSSMILELLSEFQTDKEDWFNVNARLLKYELNKKDSDLSESLETVSDSQQDAEWDILSEDTINDSDLAVLHIASLTFNIIKSLNLTDEACIRIVAFLLNGLLVSYGLYPVIIDADFKSEIILLNLEKTGLDDFDADGSRMRQYLSVLLKTMEKFYDRSLQSHSETASQETSKVKGFNNN